MSATINNLAPESQNEIARIEKSDSEKSAIGLVREKKGGSGIQETFTSSPEILLEFTYSTMCINSILFDKIDTTINSITMINTVIKSRDRELYGVVVKQRTDNSFLCLSDMIKSDIEAITAIQRVSI
jgi:hypothetical protein